MSKLCFSRSLGALSAQRCRCNSFVLRTLQLSSSYTSADSISSSSYHSSSFTASPASSSSAPAPSSPSPSPSLSSSSSPSSPTSTSSNSSSSPKQSCYQVLTSDRRLFACYHPPRQIAYEKSQPLRPAEVGLRESVTPEQAKLIKKLRKEDESLWTVSLLAKLFNVKRVVVSKIAPTSPQRREELDREQQLVTAMRPHRRRVYRARQQLLKERRIKALLAQTEYEFPATKKESESLPTA